MGIWEALNPVSGQQGASGCYSALNTEAPGPWVGGSEDQMEAGDGGFGPLGGERKRECTREMKPVERSKQGWCRTAVCNPRGASKEPL